VKADNLQPGKSQKQPPPYRGVSLDVRLIVALVCMWQLCFLDSTWAESPSNIDRTQQSEEEDFSSSPFTEYGEFNEETEEAADTKFFQHGRFFGLSLGLGFESVSGNRGALWKSGFPLIDFKVHYWFDFNVALDLGLYSAPHFFQITTPSEQRDVKFFHYGVDAKYYFETKNLSAAISFANPYVLLGIGSFSKSETSSIDQSIETDNSVGISSGGGLEFAIKHRKVYFALEGKIHFVTFKDTFTTLYQDTTPSVDDLQGYFTTFTANLMFTW
jgi:hypothetical protein